VNKGKINTSDAFFLHFCFLFCFYFYFLYDVQYMSYEHKPVMPINNFSSHLWYISEKEKLKLKVFILIGLITDCL